MRIFVHGREQWRPPAGSTRYVFDRPDVGSIIAYRARAMEILAYDEWDEGVVRVRLRRVYGPKIDAENDRGECGLRITGRPMWDVYVDGRVPLCSCCGDPWPCTKVMEERWARRHMQDMAAQLDRAGDGQCYSCGEVIRPRQPTVIAPEPNVELPGFPPPRFHLRRACSAGLGRYEEVRRVALGDDWSPLVPEDPELPVDGSA